MEVSDVEDKGSELPFDNEEGDSLDAEARISGLANSVSNCQ